MGWRLRCRLAELTASNPAYKTLASGAPEPVVIWQKSFRGNGLNGCGRPFRVARRLPLYFRGTAMFLLFLTSAATPTLGRGKKDNVTYGEGLIINVPLPEPEVAQVVEEVAQNTIIRGTKEYNKDEYVAGAIAVASTPVFSQWKEGGKVFYKVRLQALDPRNFKDGGDVGTLAVRYVVKPQGDKNTVLRIDALFVEDFRRVVHLSNGSVESNEYRDIQDHLQAVELVKKETEQALQAKQERLAKQNSAAGDTNVPVVSSSTTNFPNQTNDQIADRTNDQISGEANPKNSPAE